MLMADEAGGALASSPPAAAARFLERLERPARVLVAISGGSDSTGLLVALAEAGRACGGVELVAATVDHGLRPESAGEAQAVAAICGELGIAHVSRRWEGEKPRTGILAAARQARYLLLTDMAEAAGADVIVTGHTLDDQAETVAMRAARSHGVDDIGLAGMAEAVLILRRRWLMRPFMNCRRADIRAYLAGRGIGWIDDPSNLDSRYERVRTRQALAGQDAFDALTLRRNAARRTAISAAAAELTRRHVTLRHGQLARVAPDALGGDPDALRYGLVRLAAVLGGRPHVMAGDSRERIMGFIRDFIRGGRPGRIAAGRVVFELRRDGLYLSRENRGLPMLGLGPGEAGVWDGRYHIVNRSRDAVTVGPGQAERDAAEAMFPGSPAAAAMRAVAGRPRITGGDADSDIEVRPVLAPFEQFLADFDLALAGEIALLCGAAALAAPPVKDRARKS